MTSQLPEEYFCVPVPSQKMRKVDEVPETMRV
jgi:hypothetical protein